MLMSYTSHYTIEKIYFKEIRATKNPSFFTMRGVSAFYNMFLSELLKLKRVFSEI